MNLEQIQLQLLDISGTVAYDKMYSIEIVCLPDGDFEYIALADSYYIETYNTIEEALNALMKDAEEYVSNNK
jgi:hypothetical protein